MGNLADGFLIIGILLVVIAAGIPVGIAMAAVAMAGLALTAGLPFMLSTAESLPYALASDFAFVVVPMFVLMGALTSSAGITQELYSAAYRWNAGVRGGLYYATTLASGGFGAINGSTVVSATLFTRIALPEMLRYRYSGSLSAGCIAAAGTFAALIPPSLGMVIYGILTEESVGALLVGGLLPGLLTVAVYFVGIFVLVTLNPSAAPPVEERFTLREKLSSLKGIWAFCLLAAIVMGGIYSGAMFPSTAGAAGAGGALVISLLRGRMKMRALWDSLTEAVVMSAALFIIIIGGLFLSRLLLISGFISEISGYVTSIDLAIWQFMAILVVLYLILGMFVEGISMLVMTIPFVYPVATSLGLDPIWMGVIVVKLVEIGAITPPVGINLFAVIGASERRVNSSMMFRGIFPFILMETVTLGLLLAFPAISTWLPSVSY
ncbi:TRAP transporter large permease [Salipiger mucosus]|uniref:TRAP-type C4-dicarboxylate transport system, large permease component n=1 Tax=Salipiger mucosus DSM 16094 TaxID=1123237 RepID=S9QRL1_9RHOB|nr:TRAP transporter large permease subunit [Salipiger mucosus]EPX82273.1 TRAP-type C4-dicarboxylate transport system, large permease component [Salipiger mucosus DSM 16094]